MSRAASRAVSRVVSRAEKAALGAAAPAEVDALLATLDHPRTPEIQALRRLILGADARIGEGVKWNAPSFRTSEWFATFHLRARDGVQVVLHLGAKVRADADVRARIADPQALLDWRSADRAIATFRDLPDVAARGAAFADVVREWIAHV
ncbi:MAG: DUF1801 domain-containing protein [Gemmatirosa sp.]